MPDRLDDLTLAQYRRAAERFMQALLGDIEGWRPTGLVQAAQSGPPSLVEAVREAVERREPWRARGWKEAFVVDPDRPEVFTREPVGLNGCVRASHTEPGGICVIDDFEVMSLRVQVDPSLPPNRIEIRDPETGEVRAIWGEDGVFEVLPPRWGRA